MAYKNFIKKSGGGGHGDLCYYPLLFKALTELKGTILELGTGYGSTWILNDFVTKFKDYKLHSYEEKREWLEKFTHLNSANHELNFVTDWREVKRKHPDAEIIFVDHAPGEDRKEIIQEYKDTKGIVVCHDTEPAADYGYQMRQYFSLFKYVVEVKTDGAWATALSNEIDLTKWIGEVGPYQISEWTR